MFYCFLYLSIFLKEPTRTHNKLTRNNVTLLRAPGSASKQWSYLGLRTHSKKEKCPKPLPPFVPYVLSSTKNSTQLSLTGSAPLPLKSSADPFSLESSATLLRIESSVTPLLLESSLLHIESSAASFHIESSVAPIPLESSATLLRIENSTTSHHIVSSDVSLHRESSATFLCIENSATLLPLESSTSAALLPLSESYLESPASLQETLSLYDPEVLKQRPWIDGSFYYVL